jgi:hypothetical protein
LESEKDRISIIITKFGQNSVLAMNSSMQLFVKAIETNLITANYKNGS